MATAIRTQALPDPTTLERIRRVVGDKACLSRPEEIEPYLTDWRGLFHGRTAMVVRPASVAEVAAVMRIAHETGTPVVPQGGNTGMCGGATPYEDGAAIVLALGRLNRVRAVDPLNYTITVEAGAVLADIQRLAAEADRYFPLSLGAEGSCQIGGNLSTNAGGTAVLRYGNARELVLGLEVVLADGSIWDGLRSLRKDNTGFDLKHLFVGAEGTLGIITAAVLKLFPKPRDRRTAFAALRDVDAAIELLARDRAPTTMSAWARPWRPCSAAPPRTGWCWMPPSPRTRRRPRRSGSSATVPPNRRSWRVRRSSTTSRFRSRACRRS